MSKSVQELALQVATCEVALENCGGLGGDYDERAHRLLANAALDKALLEFRSAVGSLSAAEILRIDLKTS